MASWITGWPTCYTLPGVHHPKILPFYPPRVNFSGASPLYRFQENEFCVSICLFTSRCYEEKHSDFSGFQYTEFSVLCISENCRRISWADVGCHVPRVCCSHSASTCFVSISELEGFYQCLCRLILGSLFPMVIAELHSCRKRLPYTYPFKYVLTFVVESCPSRITEIRIPSSDEA